jgi:predicted nucleic acid-binding protein
MIVVDSTVWVSHFSDVLHEEVIRLRSIDQADEIIVGDIVLMEVLRGARSERDAKAIERRLSLFALERMLDERLAAVAARNYRILRSRGITPRSSIDLIIGTFCIERGHSLLHRDRDYLPMQEHLGLRVLT